jgi:uncharacterized membrane protein YjgN (DUF898 family)
MTQPIDMGHTRSASIDFSASAWGYTKLWLINVLLTILSLGLYGPWAKVRNNQYLYGHTSIDNHRLQYLANPMQIFIGRLLAVGVLLIFWGASAFWAPMIFIGPLLFIAAMPWLIVQGIRFTYRNTAYRNVRFNFHGNYWGACLNFIILPIVAAVTLYLLMPWVIKRIHQFMFGNCSYGDRDVSLTTDTGEYYKAALIAFGLSFLFFAVAFLVIMTPLTAFSAASETGNDLAAYAALGSMLPIFIVLYFASFLIQAFFIATIRNHIVNNLEAEGLAKFTSEITVTGYLKMMIINGLLILFTLGLAFPATKVLKLRYLSSKTTVHLEPAIDHISNTVEGTSGAFGEEAAGLFDSDFSVV